MFLFICSFSQPPQIEHRLCGGSGLALFGIASQDQAVDPQPIEEEVMARGSKNLSIHSRLSNLLAYKLFTVKDLMILCISTTLVWGFFVVVLVLFWFLFFRSIFITTLLYMHWRMGITSIHWYNISFNVSSFVSDFVSSLFSLVSLKVCQCNLFKKQL